MFCILVYLLCGRFKNKSKLKLKNSDENVQQSSEAEGATGISNPGFDYDRYKQRVRARERANKEKNKVQRDRSLAEDHLNSLQFSSVHLIPPSSDSGEYHSIDIQDPTVTSTIPEGNIRLKLWNFFANLSK